MDKYKLSERGDEIKSHLPELIKIKTRYMNIPFLKYSKIYYILSGLLFVFAVFSIVFFGLNLSSDLLGGSILEVEFEKRPENSAILNQLKEFNLGEVTFQPAGQAGVILRMNEVEEETHQKIILKLNELSELKELRFESIGPVIGRELRQKTLILVAVSLLALLVYIAISFRKVAFPFSSWQYGLVSLFTLFFDILITIGLLAYLGRFSNLQFNIPIITALLTILGYTINDKVIVLDRIRENSLTQGHLNSKELLEKSLNQVFFRSISTGSCTLLVLAALFFFGGQTLKYFSLTLIAGIIVGTYSSLFLVSPFLLGWLKFRKKT